jgi:hypothetical protein
VFYPAIATTLQSTRPDIVVTHSCGARWDGELIVMDAEQTLCVLPRAGRHRCCNPYGGARPRNDRPPPATRGSAPAWYSR